MVAARSANFREVRERYWPAVHEDRTSPEVNLARVKEIYR